ncbi:MAG: hypothetical protein HY291_23570 [Planctomycetes bacterium]|nr:hypothetical protein [Planctomycetota bacterium]
MSEAKSEFKASKLFFLLIFLGILVAIVAGSSSNSGGSQSSTGSSAPKILSGLIFGLLGLAAGFLAGVALILWFVSKSTGMAVVNWLDRYNKAVHILNAGDADAALEILTPLLETVRKRPQSCALTLQAIGTAHFKKGDPVTAIDKLEEGLQMLPAKTGRLIRRSDLREIRVHTLARMIELNAVLNSPELTPALFEEARETDAGENSQSLLLAEALCLCRKNEFNKADDLIRRHWRVAAGRQIETYMRAVRLVWAYALTQLPPAPEREQEIVKLLGGVHPCKPGEFDHYTGRWPELKAFLVKHGLSS